VFQKFKVKKLLGVINGESADEALYFIQKNLTPNISYKIYIKN